MIKLGFKLALRFINSKKYGALAKFISIASTAGIAIGVCALILGLSAMNGFEFELKNRVLSLIPAGEITSANPNGFESTDLVINKLKEDKRILECAPTITLNGAFNNGSSFAPAVVVGINPSLEKKVIDIENFMSVKVDTLNETNSVILGAGIARKLNLKVGDEITLSSVDSTKTNDNLGHMVASTLKIIGLFSTGGQIDSNFAFINLDTAKSISKLLNANTIHIKVDNMLNITQILSETAPYIPQVKEAKSWIDTQGKLYNDINMIRGIMYLAMLLVIGVACFNIVSNLVMAVSEKKHEIAILLTMGAKRKLIILAFTLMGVLSAIKGCLYGVFFGVIIALATPFVTSHFKDVFGFDLLNKDIYFINFIPTRLDINDVLIVLLCAIVMSLIASIYPAIKASKIKPALELNI